MSTNKKKKQLMRISFLLLIPAFLLLGMVLYSGSKMLPQKYYKISPRVKTAERTIVESETNKNKTIGWLRVQGTSIDLPIISNEDEDYPVEVEGYAWLDETLSKFRNNTTIMGHNIFNLSNQPKLKSNSYKRFEELMNFIYPDFIEENKYIQLTMNNEDKLYKIFMVGFVPLRDELFEFTEDNYLKKLSDYNIYDFKVDVNKDDELVSLVTCSRFFGINADKEFYVVARLVRDNEKVENYHVSRNKKYEIIEQILKNDGGAENEV